MKKVAAILSVVVFGLGMVSCEAETTTQNDKLYDTQSDLPCDTCEVEEDGPREG